MPFIFAGASINHPRLFADCPDGPFSINHDVGSRAERGASRQHRSRRHVDAYRHPGRAGGGGKAAEWPSRSLSCNFSGAGPAPRRGRIFTIPPSAPFLDALARAILDGNLPREGGTPPGPAELAAYQIYLPNRAACRALADAFLRASDSRATLLPRIKPLGSAEEDALLLLRPDDDGEADGRPICRSRRPSPRSTGAWR